jgi:hypothetical protein
VGLSRDLLIRAVAYDLQERTHGGASAALRRRLQSLAEASEKGALAVDRGRAEGRHDLVRQWRGYTHTVLVQKDGFEHEGQRYRSLTVIAGEMISAFSPFDVSTVFVNMALRNPICTEFKNLHAQKSD